MPEVTPNTSIGLGSTLPGAWPQQTGGLAREYHCLRWDYFLLSLRVLGLS
jgi:hypothetical protein